MGDKIQSFNANALINDIKIQLTIHYASKFTVFVKFSNDVMIESETILSGFTIDINGRNETLSPCRYLLDFQSNQYDGKLVFTDNIYDFDYLFYNQEIINLTRLTSDLELIMTKKNEINKEFKKYTSDLAYDLEVYRNFFDDFDAKIARENPFFQNEIRKTLIQVEGRKFKTFFLDQLLILEKIIQDFNRSEHKNHGFYFRKQMMNFILCSSFMNRTNTKPRGYAGDSLMMNMIYENNYEGNSTFSKLLHKISVEHPAAQAVRNRRKTITSKIRTELENSNKKKILSILSVACGPACELEDLIKSKEDIHQVHLTLLDQDQLALEEARSTVFAIEKKLGLKIKVTYLQDSIRTIMRDKKWAEHIGKFDIIYSMGLFDYLTTLVGKVLISRLYNLLNENGKILIGNFHFMNKSKRFLEYWHDWVLFYRNEKEMKELLEKTGAIDINVFFEDTHCQMFLEARKGYEAAD